MENTVTHTMRLEDAYNNIGEYIGQRSVCACGDYASAIGNAITRAQENAAHMQHAAMRGEDVS